MVIAISGIALAGVGILWSHDRQREREQELLFVGDAYRKAIGSYYESSPGNKVYPKTLEELLLDKRFPFKKRHLRKLYADPMSKNAGWALVKLQGNIIGVYSTANATPIKQAQFASAYESFAEAKQYSDWKFVYTPGQ